LFFGRNATRSTAIRSGAASRNTSQHYQYRQIAQRSSWSDSSRSSGSAFSPPASANFTFNFKLSTVDQREQQLQDHSWRTFASRIRRFYFQL
jgi:hypothetical protein